MTEENRNRFGELEKVTIATKDIQNPDNKSAYAKTNNIHDVSYKSIFKVK